MVRETDVVVCGGGPAGIAAAIASARTGARTQLIEWHGCLGGVWTAGLLSNIIDGRDKPGLMREIMEKLGQRGARATGRGKDNVYDVEAMKLLLDEMCEQAGVEVRLHTAVVDAHVDEQGRIRDVLTESKSGREAWRASVFVDATGDGDLAARCGCQFAVGRESDGQTQPMSLMALISGLEASDVRRYIAGEDFGSESPKQDLHEQLNTAGVDPSYAMPTLFRVYDDLFALMANHEYSYNAFNADHVTEATMRARGEVNRIVDGLRSLGGVWEGIRLVATASQIGVRDGRRIQGRYRVTLEDLTTGIRHDDAVCRVNFGVDIHGTDPKVDKAYSNEGHKSQPYDIPYRALIAKDVDALLLAGRCISGDFFAHASYRVTGNAVAMGQAAGAAAAVSANCGKLPHELLWTEIEPAIERINAATPVL